MALKWLPVVTVGLLVSARPCVGGDARSARDGSGELSIQWREDAMLRPGSVPASALAVMGLQDTQDLQEVAAGALSDAHPFGAARRTENVTRLTAVVALDPVRGMPPAAMLVDCWFDSRWTVLAAATRPRQQWKMSAKPAPNAELESMVGRRGVARPLGSERLHATLGAVLSALWRQQVSPLEAGAVVLRPRLYQFATPYREDDGSVRVDTETLVAWIVEVAGVDMKYHGWAPTRVVFVFDDETLTRCEGSYLP